MAKEIEPKFLVDPQRWRPQPNAKPKKIFQNYIDLDAPGQQVRITEDGKVGHITFAGPDYAAQFFMPIGMAQEMRQTLLFSDKDKGVLANAGGQNVRIRFTDQEGKIMKVRWAVKKPTDEPATKDEFEADVPFTEQLTAYDAGMDVLKHLKHFGLRKNRFEERHADGHLWEYDVYQSLDKPLITAEVELQSRDEPYAKPASLGREVTGEHGYSNYTLARTGKVPEEKSSVLYL